MKDLGRRFLWIYLTLTLCFALVFGGLLLRYGADAFQVMRRPTSSSTAEMDVVVFSVSWLFIGFVTCLGQVPTFARRHAAFLLVFVLMGFSYLNLVREPHTTGPGDFRPYYLAAVDMRQDRPISQQRGRLYLYPPLLASLLSPFVPLGMPRLNLVFQVLNYAAVLLLMILLYLALQRYRFSKELAALALLGVMAANVPISRTLINHQVNLHVANLILLSLLLFGRHHLWSACALSLAIHLKVYPLVLVLPFLYQKEWRWCAGFVASQGLIIVATSVLTSPRYYVEFLTQVSALTEIAPSNVSVDSFLYNLLRLFDLSPWAGEEITAHALRLLLAIGVLIPWYQLAQRGLFTDSPGGTRVILNSYVLLPVLMLAVSPSIWTHHFVLLMFPVLVLASSLRATWEVWLFGYAYAFIFLMPVYDIYVVSYLRLLGLILLIVLINGAANRPTEAAPEWFRRLNQRLAPALGRFFQGLRTSTVLHTGQELTRSSRR
jgi:Glycosyltransferase family 87